MKLITCVIVGIIILWLILTFMAVYVSGDYSMTSILAIAFSMLLNVVLRLIAIGVVIGLALYIVKQL